MPRLQDMFQTFLRELRPEDLSGSEGTLQLRTSCSAGSTSSSRPPRSARVLIEEMLIN